MYTIDKQNGYMPAEYMQEDRRFRLGTDTKQKGTKTT